MNNSPIPSSTTYHYLQRLFFFYNLHTTTFHGFVVLLIQLLTVLLVERDMHCTVWIVQFYYYPHQFLHWTLVPLLLLDRHSATPHSTIVFLPVGFYLGSSQTPGNYYIIPTTTYVSFTVDIPSMPYCVCVLRLLDTIISFSTTIVFMDTVVIVHTTTLYLHTNLPILVNFSFLYTSSLTISSTDFYCGSTFFRVWFLHSIL